MGGPKANMDRFWKRKLLLPQRNLNPGPSGFQRGTIPTVAPSMPPLVQYCFNPLTPNDLKRRRAVSPLKIKIPSKHMREKPTNTTIIHSVY
jgi:hypothetical protein